MATLLDGALVADLESFARDHGLTPFIVLLGVYSLLLARYSGQEDLVIGVPTAGRNHPEVEDVVGFFAQTLPLRIDVSADPSFLQLLERIKDTVLAGFDHQAVPFEMVVAELRPPREPGRTPVFQTMFSLQTISPQPARFQGLIDEDYAVGSSTAPFDFSMEIDPRRDGWHAEIRYRTDLFESETVQRMLADYETLIRRVLLEPERCVTKIQLVSDAARHRAVYEWNDTQRPYPASATIVGLFAECVEKWPDVVALAQGSNRLTYSDLNAEANKVAHYLLNNGVSSGSVVALHATPTTDTVVSMLAVLKAGGAYLPVDPEQPQERIRYMLENAGATVLLAPNGESLKRFDSDDGVASALDSVTVIDLDSVWSAITGESDVDPVDACAADAIANIIYTSGSSGRPKGVEITHRGIIRLVRGVSYIDFGPRRTMLQVGTFSFDASTFEVWGPLLNGSTCVVYPERVPTPSGLSAVIEEHGVTTTLLTPTLFNSIVDDDPESLAGLQELVVGGEALSPPHIGKAQSALPDLVLINAYGPTENTVISSTYRIEERDWASQRSVPIGTPISNSTMYILDSSMQICPVGVPGELHVGGEGVARGYVGDPELTAERFVADPFAKDPGARLYKTGDRCRYLPGGVVEYLGRVDDQVKIRGYRIEPGEVASVLMSHEEVDQAAVIAIDAGTSQAYLAAYVVPVDQERIPAVEDLKRHVRQAVPNYMVPEAYMVMEQLPLSSAGKLDRSALPPAIRSVSASVAEYPRDATEAQIAAIWSRVLGVGGIGRDDDFFALGGNSLLALRLFSEIESTFGRDVPLSALFEAPRLSELADVVRDRAAEDSWSVIVPMHRGGERPPFFCVHGMGGNVVGQSLLAQMIDEDQPFYGIQARGLRDGDAPLRSIRSMASLYCSKIKEVQPSGPYIVGGHCLGGMVAFEMAQQLSSAGEDVALLVLIDPAAMPFAPAPDASRLVHNVRAWHATLSQRELRNRLLKVARDQVRPQGTRFQQIRRAHSLARDSYAPGRYSGPTLLVRSKAEPERQEEWTHRFSRWRAYLDGDVQESVIDAVHALILVEPAVRHIAGVIDTAISGMNSEAASR